MIESPKQYSRGKRAKDYASVEQTDENENEIDSDSDNNETEDDLFDPTPTAEAGASDAKINPHHTVHHDTATFDFVGMTQALFSDRKVTRWVMFFFYVNIFLVLGDYILVMSHAVSALVGEERMCLPQAGVLASTLMYAVTQTRTMVRYCLRRVFCVKETMVFGQRRWYLVKGISI